MGNTAMKREVPHFRIGLLLTEAGILTPEQLDVAIQSGESSGVPFLRVLVASGLLTQHELQAVVRAQSLIWKGLLDVDRAIVALNVVHSQGASIDDALQSAGWQRSEAATLTAPMQQVMTPTSFESMPPALSGLTVNATVPVSTGAPATPRSCQYCGAVLSSSATWCHFCTGEIPQAVIAREIPEAAHPTPRRSPSVKPAETAFKNPTDWASSGTTRDPLFMAFLSGCCLPGVGQLLMGQVMKGLIVFVLTIILAFMTGGISSLLLFPLAGIDAFLLADKIKNGKQIGPWEFF
jgi:TM2 domain-containing membrane protein YozV